MIYRIRESDAKMVIESKYSAVNFLPLLDNIVVHVLYKQADVSFIFPINVITG